MEFLNQLFDLLTSPSGSLVYFMVLVFCTVSAFWWSYAQWKSTEFPQAKRTVIGLGLLFGAQVVMIVVGVLAWQGILDPNVLLPVLDRAVVFFSVIWIIWLWAFPEPDGRADMGAIILSAIDGIALVGSVILRTQQFANVPFNDTIQSTVWTIAILALTVFGIAIIFYRRPNNWENGLAMLILILAGFVLDLFFPASGGNYSGFGRLMLMAAFPILLTLPQRFPTPSQALPRQSTVRTADQEGQNEEASAEGDGKVLRERRRYSTDAKTLHALLDLAGESDPNKINDDITRAVAQSMLADLSFLIYLTENKQMVISSGYDLIREEKLEGTPLNRDMIPLLANAVQRGRPLRLPASSTSSDLRGLGDLLGLSSPGHLLNVPIANEKGPIGSILLLSPYSNRLWSADDQAFLTNIATSFTSIVERGQLIAKLEHERDYGKTGPLQSQTIVDELEAQVVELKFEIEKNRQGAESLVALTALHEEAQHRIHELEQEAEASAQQLADVEKENDALRAGVMVETAAVAVSPKNDQLESELKITLGEVARLQNALADANMKILELEKQSSGSMSSDQAEVIASISQELRQPMSSIIGYTDLLLGESVGILGALQRKFIERIKASTERIGSLIEDLIQITTIGTGLMALKPEAIDLNLIIDNAMAYTSSQLRERNITLRIDLPKSTEHIYADREALQQILIHLLQNAGAASPVEGTVTLRVRTEKQDSNDFVLIQVADTGGGIPTEDLQRVFSRLYRADNVLIQGVGDTGVGLSIAKTLTEAQGGRIWVDSEIGVGATFSVLLPVSQAEPEAKAEKEQKGV
jgi:signal transduction histidine kinase/GAF domain-containing protein